MKWAKRIQEYINYESVADAVADGEFDIVQPKHDGWWACAVIKSGVATIYSRQGVKKATMQARHAPPCILIGEYIVGTQRSTSADNEGVLVVFDALEVDGGEQWAHSYRLRMERYRNMVLGSEPWLDIVETLPVYQAEALWSVLVADGCEEGLVFRNSLHNYEEAVIGRVKKTYTMDYVVMGVERGQGRNKDRAGAVICGLYEGRKLVEKVRVGGGWSDAQREELFAKPKAFIGRVLEVKGWQVFESGSMRHPNAVRFRDDKKARECVWHKKEVQ
jgi:ATP-dependent DNA ligase